MGHKTRLAGHSLKAPPDQDGKRYPTASTANASSTRSDLILIVLNLIHHRDGHLLGSPIRRNNPRLTTGEGRRERINGAEVAGPVDGGSATLRTPAFTIFSPLVQQPQQLVPLCGHTARHLARRHTEAHEPRLLIAAINV